jgi:hypothetical protein
MTTTPMPSPQLRARVLAAVEQEPVPSNRQGARRRVAVVLFGFAVAGAITLAAAGHGPVARTPRPLRCTMALELLWLSIAVAATWAGVRRGRSMLGPPRAWRTAVAVLTPAAMLAAWLPVALGWPQTLADGSGLRAHGTCIVMTMILAAGPFVAFARLLRGTDPIRPRVTGAALAAAAGAWGDAAHVFVCGYAAPAHIVLGHILPIVVLTLVGVAIGDRVVALRPLAA